MKNVIKTSSILVCLSFLFSITTYGQNDYSKEVSSLDNIITALYASISGEKGEPRQWELFTTLFTENAQLIPTFKNKEGKIGFQSMSPAEYKEGNGEWLVTNGFHETETHRVTETYGPVVHVFSTYDSRNSKNDEKPFARGINSIQLLNDGERWWIMNIYWSAETTENPIPDKYLSHEQ